MKTFYKKFGLILLSVFTAGAFLSFDVQAQRTRKPVVSKRTQMNRLANQAVKEMESGKYDQAIATFDKCIALKPVFDNAYKCYMGRGTAYFVLNRYEEAIPDFNVAYDSYLDHSVNYFRGRAYFELKKYEEANKDFFAVTIFVEESEIKKNYPDVYNYRGASFTALEKYDQAIDAYKKSLEINARSGDAYFGRGIAYELKSDFENAEKDLRKAVELDPNAKPLVDKALLRIEERKNAGKAEPKTTPDQKREREEYSIETDDITALKIIADRYFNMSEYEKAAEVFSKIFRLDPKNAEAVYRRGTAYGNLDKFEAAVADYTKAIEIDPGYAKAYLSRGATVYESGRYEDAIRDLNKSIELNPADYFGYVYRAKTYCKLGKKELAVADEKKAETLGGFITEPCR